MNTKKKKYDDLTEIKGIGLHRQQWLKGSFGVCTFSDLAALTVDEVESRSKTEGGGVGRKAIEGWIDEAKALVEAASPEPKLEAAAVESGGGASIPSGETNWNSLASFRVDFFPGRQQIVARSNGPRYTTSKPTALKNGPAFRPTDFFNGFKIS